MADTLKQKIRTVRDWPKPGIMFRDISTLLQDSEGFNHMINLLVKRYENVDIDIIAGIDSRGFIIASALAYKLKKGMVLIRKQGKLPPPTISEEYELEYGKDKIEIYEDAIKEGEKVLVCDDLIATGGTAIASCNLVKKLKGEIVEFCAVIDLPDIGGKEKIENSGYKVFNLVEFKGE